MQTSRSFDSTCRKLYDNGISHPYIYGVVVYASRDWRYNECKLIDYSIVHVENL